MQHRAPAVALLSGGPDSATAAAIRAEACDISFLHFDYGQAQEPNELASAETIARHFGKSVDVFKVPELTSFFGRASNGVLTGSSCPTLGHGEAYDALPYIFGWAYSIAVSYAIVQGIRRLIIGVNGLDAELDPQFREEALRAFERSVRIATDLSDFVLDAPLLHTSKASVMALGDKLGLPLHSTWSCLRPVNGVHCGKCRGCLRRQQAFQVSNIADATSYVSPTDASLIQLPSAEESFWKNQTVTTQSNTSTMIPESQIYQSTDANQKISSTK
jgi:7-cyano-7-deazaguanine synthase